MLTKALHRRYLKLIGIFNQTFQNSKSSQEVIKYEEPEQLCSSSINCTELGQDNVSDFGRTIKSYNELGYTDYKQAYIKTIVFT